MTARSIRALIVAFTLGLVLTPAALAQTPDQAEGSWRFVDVEISPEEPTSGQIARVQFSIEDQDGEPISGLNVTARLRAPSTAYDDSPPPPRLTTVGRELDEPGRYEASVALNQSGRWWIEVEVENDTGQSAESDHFIVVGSNDENRPATTDSPVFLRSDQWDTYFRIDPSTGSVATIDGDEVFRAGDRWWTTEITREPRGSVSTEYGGTWQLRLTVRDAMTGEEITSIDVGDIRASVYPGSQQDPAIATSISVSSDGSAIYLYWARQLGEGWVSHIAIADTESGEIETRRVLNGAIVSNGFWAEIYHLDQEQLVVAEQVVELASVVGYRLTILNRDTLEIQTQYRRTESQDDSLTHCILSYPGPLGRVGGENGYRYSLCSPPNVESDPALVVWNPMTGQTIHTIDLQGVTESEPSYTDGIASPDDTQFYAVNSRTMRITEVDMQTGEVLREKALIPEDSDPSTLDRFFEWFFGAWEPPAAAAAGTVNPSVTIDPEGDTLYLIAQPENGEPGILVVDVETLEIQNHILTGEVPDGLLATPDGHVAVVTSDSDAEADTVTVLNEEGGTDLSFMLPGRSDVIGSRR